MGDVFHDLLRSRISDSQPVRSGEAAGDIGRGRLLRRSEEPLNALVSHFRSGAGEAVLFARQGANRELGSGSFRHAGRLFDPQREYRHRYHSDWSAVQPFVCDLDGRSHALSLRLRGSQLEPVGVHAVLFYKGIRVAESGDHQASLSTVDLGVMRKCVRFQLSSVGCQSEDRAMSDKTHRRAYLFRLSKTGASDSRGSSFCEGVGALVFCCLAIRPLRGGLDLARVGLAAGSPQDRSIRSAERPGDRFWWRGVLGCRRRWRRWRAEGRRRLRR